MARVDHKLVRQRLNERRSSITDKEFFSSRLLAGHFEAIAEAQTRRYHYNRRVRVHLYWEPMDGNVALTDNQFIRINAGNTLVTDVVGRENRYQVVCGLFAHELGHVLFTDFPMMQTYTNYMKNGKWYPYEPTPTNSKEERDLQEFWDYVNADEKNMRAMQFIALRLQNIIEDAYIENCMLNRFPGTLGFGLDTLREVHFEKMDTVTKLKERENDGTMHIFESLMQILLSYAKFGEIKYGDEPFTDYRIKTVFSLITDIDNAIMSRDSKTRFAVVNTIIMRCFEVVKNYCEHCKDEFEKSSEESLEESIAKAMKKIAGSSMRGTGSSMPVSMGSEELEESEESSTAAKRAATKKDAEQEENGEEGENSETGASAPPTTEGGAEGSEVEMPDEVERIPYHETDDVATGDDGSLENNEEYEREKYENAASDIEKILENMAERAACQELEDERAIELNDFAKNISYGDAHKGVKVRVNRISDVDDELVEQYDYISKPLLTISKQLQRSIEKQLKESQRGAKQTNLLMGRRLDAHSLHRNDGKVFYKNNLPNKIELAVGLLVDESGSMWGDRASYARAAALILYDFCDSLGIPVTVYGHSTNWRDSQLNVELFSYAEFDSIDNLDRYRIMDIQARGNNRDGAALRFVAEKLVRRPEESKLLILISDGQPADMGYSGSAAEEDLRGIKQEYTRKGITFVAAAIGDDKPSIERIYGDSFMDITDLGQLPTKLTSVVKRHIRI